MRGKRLSDDLVGVIYSKHDEGLSNREIATLIHVSEHAIRNAIKRRVPNSLVQMERKLGPLAKPQLALITIFSCLYYCCALHTDFVGMSYPSP
jgi:predicted DNA-binding protein YlxM (UPF0122 family)